MSVFQKSLWFYRLPPLPVTYFGCEPGSSVRTIWQSNSVKPDIPRLFYGAGNSNKYSVNAWRGINYEDDLIEKVVTYSDVLTRSINLQKQDQKNEEQSNDDDHRIIGKAVNSNTRNSVQKKSNSAVENDVPKSRKRRRSGKRRKRRPRRKVNSNQSNQHQQHQDAVAENEFDRKNAENIEHTKIVQPQDSDVQNDDVELKKPRMNRRNNAQNTRYSKYDHPQYSKEVSNVVESNLPQISESKELDLQKLSTHQVWNRNTERKVLKP